MRVEYPKPKRGKKIPFWEDFSNFREQPSNFCFFSLHTTWKSSPSPQTIVCNTKKTKKKQRGIQRDHSFTMVGCIERKFHASVYLSQESNFPPRQVTQHHRNQSLPSQRPVLLSIYPLLCSLLNVQGDPSTQHSLPN